MKYCPNCATPLVDRYLHGHDRPACPACGFVYYAGPKVAVGVMIAQEGKLLLNRRAIDPGKGRWSFPSGYVDLGESPASAAIREVKEETGYDIQLSGLVGVYASPTRPVVLVVYTGEVIGGTPTGCDEVVETGLFSETALPPLAFEHDEQIVSDWRSWKERGVTRGGIVE
ncbi:MAG TPA: NUDIX hydrolase, partial [Chloroflexota bacterium]|nr:NUDIX hydrolase [Chloroflexota bacterium]